MTDPRALAGLWVDRWAWSHKNRLGHLDVVAGSLEMAGAAVLVCRGALAVGCGLVTLHTPDVALARLGALPPTVMVSPGLLADALDAVGDRTFAVGPGIGGGRPLSEDVLRALARLQAGGTGVFDADGLQGTAGPVGEGVVRTPHPGEAGRLLGRSAKDVEADRFGAARSLAAQGGVTLLKGRYTLVARGGDVAVNPSGSPALATAGSGDVLTGVIGGLLARGHAAWDAARIGAWLHGRAGERLSAVRADGWTAEDIGNAIPDAIEDLRASRG